VRPPPAALVEIPAVADVVVPLPERAPFPPRAVWAGAEEAAAASEGPFLARPPPPAFEPPPELFLPVADELVGAVRFDPRAVVVVCPPPSVAAVSASLASRFSS
jgi:hypothetical protein